MWANLGEEIAEQFAAFEGFLDSRSDRDGDGSRSIWSHMFTGTAKDLHIKTGRAPRMRATCHPERPAHAQGKCDACYSHMRKHRRRQAARTPEKQEQYRAADRIRRQRQRAKQS